jgi:hypothetical protein
MGQKTPVTEVEGRARRAISRPSPIRPLVHGMRRGHRCIDYAPDRGWALSSRFFIHSWHRLPDTAYGSKTYKPEQRTHI